MPATLFHSLPYSLIPCRNNSCFFAGGFETRKKSGQGEWTRPNVVRSHAQRQPSPPSVSTAQSLRLGGHQRRPHRHRRYRQSHHCSPYLSSSRSLTYEVKIRTQSTLLSVELLPEDSSHRVDCSVSTAFCKPVDTRECFHRKRKGIPNPGNVPAKDRTPSFDL